MKYIYIYTLIAPYVTFGATYGTSMLDTEHRKMTYGTTSYKYEHVPYPT